jgi:hypothetical protein
MNARIERKGIRKENNYNMQNMMLDLNFTVFIKMALIVS